MTRKVSSRGRLCIFSLFLLALLACGAPGVTITSPENGSTVPSPVHLVATADGGTQKIANMDIQIDGQTAGNPVPGPDLNETLDLPAGNHKILVEARDFNGHLYQSTVEVTVSGSVTDSRAVQNVPLFDHVYVVVEENHEYDKVVNGPDMPYFQSLMKAYAIAAQYYGDTHPSIGNYFMMTTGEIVTNNDGYSKSVAADNIVRQLARVNKSWKSYAEALPYAGYTGGNKGRYARRHNPFSFFTDVLNDNREAQNLVPLDQLAQDQDAGTIPNLSFIVPDLDDDAHDGSLAAADEWLQNNIDPIIRSADFQNNGLLVITFDEGNSSDKDHGGGHIPTLVVSSKVKKGYQSTTLYQHENLLSLVCAALGIQSCPGAASTADAMSEFFN